jgi:DNA-nicking Smr family endonuclease
MPRETRLPPLTLKKTPPDDTSDDDAFAQAMADVVRLPQDPRGRVPLAPVADTSAVPISPDVDNDEAADEAFVAAGVNRREIRKLKRGEYKAADLCDLHGMTAAEAHARVDRFIANSRHRQHRCVCIVHGRGLHSEGQEPVLRARVRAQLRSHPSVLAFADAPRADGGAGAVYVLLRV